MDAVKPNRVALSRELSEFLVELSIAVQKHSMYRGRTPRWLRLLPASPAAPDVCSTSERRWCSASRDDS